MMKTCWAIQIHKQINGPHKPVDDDLRMNTSVVFMVLQQSIVCTMKQDLSMFNRIVSMKLQIMRTFQNQGMFSMLRRK
jgi:hypothetical protein